MSNKNNIIKFPNSKESPESVLEDALKEAKDMKGVVVIGLFEEERNGETFQAVEHYIGGKKEFTASEVLWLIKRLEFDLLHIAKDIEENEDGE